MSASKLPQVVVVKFDTIDSTSLHARRELLAGRLPGSQPVVFIADEQTGGIGQFGRRWQSPRGGLWMTLCWPFGPSTPTDSPPPTLALAIGVTLCGVLASTLRDCGSSASPKLKWPNDIMLNDRKVAGVLTEHVKHAGRTALLVGIGVNVLAPPRLLDPNLAESSGALADSLPSGAGSIDIQLLAAECTAALSATLHSPPSQVQTVADARRLQWGLGRIIAITRGSGTKHDGVIRGITEAGDLLAEVEGRAETISSAGQIGEASRNQVTHFTKNPQN